MGVSCGHCDRRNLPECDPEGKCQDNARRFTMQKHTPGPWDFCSTLHNGESYQRIVSPDGKRVDKYGSHRTIALVPWDTDGDVQANAERIVACVNGCAGIADPSAVGDVLEALRTARTQVEAFCDTCDKPDPDTEEEPCEFCPLRVLDGAAFDALAKAEGR